MTGQVTEIQERFRELEEDSRRLLSLINLIKIDLIVGNDKVANNRLERSIFLTEKIHANLYSLYISTEKQKNLGDKI